MASKKEKKKKKKRNPNKPRNWLWLRDLLNILGGLLVGSLGVFFFQSYSEGKAENILSQQYLEIIEKDFSTLKQFAERYLALTEKQIENAQALEGLDIDRPIYSPESYAKVKKDLHSLEPEAFRSVLDLHQILQDTELLRKCIIEHQNSPQEIGQVLIREFLRNAYDGSQLIPPLRGVLER